MSLILFNVKETEQKKNPTLTVTESTWDLQEHSKTR